MSRMTDLGSWLLMRLACGPYTDAVAGDLMEGVRAGRSNFWYWRQVMAAIGMAWMAWLQTRMGRVVFAVGLGAVYQTWWYRHIVERQMLLQLLRWINHNDVPVPACLLLVGMLFVGVGFLLYLALGKGRGREVTARLMVWGTLGGLVVFVVAQMVWSIVLWFLIRHVHSEGWRTVDARLCMTMMMAVSLYYLIAWALPVERRGVEMAG